MHKGLFILLLAFVVLVSGCITGQVARRQAAEPTEVLQQDNATDYYEIEAAPEDCICPGSLKTCPDGFNATCENECTNSTCSRCVPSCSGHERCNESWFCSEWQPCGNGSQSRRCMDSSFCNKTNTIEKRACETDRCSSNSDCPAGTRCSPYICDGAPKQCKQVIIIPCCGDGLCEGNEDTTCASDCPLPAQQNATNGTQNQTQTNQTQNISLYGHFIINEIMYNPINESGGEYVELFNPTEYEANLSGIILSDNNENDTIMAFSNASPMLQPLSYAVITDLDTFMKPAALHLSVDDNKIGNGLSNTGDWVIIFYQNLSVADILNYTEMNLCDDGLSLEKCSNGTWICNANGTIGTQNSC